LNTYYSTIVRVAELETEFCVYTVLCLFIKQQESNNKTKSLFLH